MRQQSPRGLVRHAKRLADRLHAPWTALYLETRRSLQLGEEDRDRIAEALRLAERLEGEAITLPATARRIADDVLSFARKNNVTHIIIGKSTRSRWFEILHGSVVHELVRKAGNISVHVIAGEEFAPEPNAARSINATAANPFDPLPYIVALAAVAAAVGVGMVARPLLGIENVDLILLTAVVGVAVRYGLLPSLWASVIASLGYNFFFLPPVYTFTLTDPTNVAAFVLFTVLAIVVSNLAGRGQTQTTTALQRVRSIESLYAFSRKLAGAGRRLAPSMNRAIRSPACDRQIRITLRRHRPSFHTASYRSGRSPERHRRCTPTCRLCPLLGEPRTSSGCRKRQALTHTCRRSRARIAAQHWSADGAEK